MEIKQNNSKVLFFIILCLSLLTFNSITVQATDVSGSAFVLPTEAIALHRVELAVIADGAQGVVNGASVNISCSSGVFELSGESWVEETTNSSGIAEFWWVAPDTPTEVDPINVTITADITSSPDFYSMSQNITVHPIDFTTSVIDVQDDPVYELHNSRITIIVRTDIFPEKIVGATVDLSCDEGVFEDTDTATTSGITDSEGELNVIWFANISVPISSPLIVNIYADISYTDKIVTANLTNTVTVNPMDVDSSTLQLSDYDVGGSYPVTVTLRAVGDYGPVSNADIFLDALDGDFENSLSNTTGITDQAGYFIQEWIAPDVVTDINITITAEIRFPTTTLLNIINVTVLVRSFMHNFTSIDLVANPTSGTVGDTIDITLTVLNEIGLAVPLANATFIAPGGEFVGSGTDSITVQTDASGIVIVTWDTSSLDTPVGGLSYQIDVTLIREFYNTNTSDIDVFIDPVIQKLETSSTPVPSTITKGANVTITVQVTANSQNIEGVTVQIIGLSGIFASSNDVVTSLNTDALGIVEFTWITADMTVSSTTNYTFEVQATLPGYETSDVEYVIIEVEPIEIEPTTPTGDGLSQNEMLGILLGAAGGLLVIGVVSYLIIRRKSVS
ncbi:MAG: hypothetical protein ACTSQF_01425 [Candidatus Heimdallarchaeaceae archaeon]